MVREGNESKEAVMGRCATSQTPFESTHFYSSHCHRLRSGHLESSKGLLIHFPTSPPSVHLLLNSVVRKIHLHLQPS